MRTAGKSKRTRRSEARASPRGASGALPSKVRRPHVGRALLRTRLFELLDRCSERPVTWITGPAGAGKTTLAASYLDVRERSSLWYQIDARDEDVATFFFYLRLAHARASRSPEDSLPLLTPEHQAGVGTFARRFFEGLVARRRSDAVLVIDNYQDLPEGCALHGLLAENLPELPSSMRVLVLSRKDPPPAWARARANDAVARVGWDDLRLTLDESEGLVRARSRRPDVGDDELRRIHALTHGWAAGIVLMLEHGAGSGREARGGAMELAEQATFDYLAHEILGHEDQAIQAALMRLAWLPSMTSGAIAALTGEPRVERALADLASSHSFTLRHAHGPTSYEFHPLFRRFLQSRARGTLSPAELLDHQRAAAARLVSERRWDEAAALLIEAGDSSTLAELVVGHAGALLSQGRNQTLESWLRALPPDLCERDPRLALLFGGARFPYDLAESRGHFERALAGFERVGDVAGQALAWSSLVESIVYEWSDSAALAPWIAAAEARLVPRFDELSGEARDRLVVGMFLARMHREPEHPHTELWAARMDDLVRGLRDPSERVLLGARLLQYFGLWLGDFARAGLVLDSMRPGRAETVSPAAEIMWRAQEAIYLFRRGRCGPARAAIEEAHRKASETGVRLWDFTNATIFVYIAIVEQDYERASAHLEEVAAAASMRRPLQMAAYEILCSWLARSRGDDIAALEHARRLVLLVDRHGGSFEQAAGSMELSYALLAAGAADEAEARAHRALALAEGARSPWLTYLAKLCLAYVHAVRGDEGGATRQLREAFASGRVQGYFSLHYLAPRPTAELCALALERGIEPEYAQRLVRAHRLAPVEPPIRVEAWPWTVRIYTLGRFEVIDDGQPLRFAIKAQRKPLELVKALVALGGRNVREERLRDILWPDAEADAAHSAFSTTLQRLRKLVGEETLLLRDGKLSLASDRVWVDAWAFDSLLDEADPPEPGVADAFERALALYRGPFLPDDDGAFVLGPRERLRSRLVSRLLRRARGLRDAGRTEAAAELYERGLENDELSEELYRGLMTCYAESARRAEALVLYERCRGALSRELGTDPSEPTRALYRRVKAGLVV